MAKNKNDALKDSIKEWECILIEWRKQVKDGKAFGTITPRTAAVRELHLVNGIQTLKKLLNRNEQQTLF